MMGSKLKPRWKVWRFDQMATNVNVKLKLDLTRFHGQFELLH